MPDNYVTKAEFKEYRAHIDTKFDNLDEKIDKNREDSKKENKRSKQDIQWTVIIIGGILGFIQYIQWVMS